MEFEGVSNQKSGNKRNGAGSGVPDLVSEQDSEGNSSPEAAQDGEKKPHLGYESLPSKATLLAVMNQGEDFRTSISNSSTGRRQSSATGQGANIILKKAPKEFQQVLNHKKQIDNLNKVLREKKIFDAFTTLIGQSTLDSLFHYIAILQFMVN